jgi:hypothetical protein
LTKHDVNAAASGVQQGNMNEQTHLLGPHVQWLVLFAGVCLADGLTGLLVDNRLDARNRLPDHLAARGKNVEEFFSVMR